MTHDLGSPYQGQVRLDNIDPGIICAHQTLHHSVDSPRGPFIPLGAEKAKNISNLLSFLTMDGWNKVNLQKLQPVNLSSKCNLVTKGYLWPR